MFMALLTFIIVVVAIVLSFVYGWCYNSRSKTRLDKQEESIKTSRRK